MNPQPIAHDVATRMRIAVTIVLIVLVSLAAVAVVCAVNAPRWMDGQPVATTRKA